MTTLGPKEFHERLEDVLSILCDLTRQDRPALIDAVATLHAMALRHNCRPENRG
jgi:hypothetical protein